MKPLAKRKPIRVKRVMKNSHNTELKDSYILRLFVAGATDRSHLAVLRVRELCETVLKDRVKLSVIDIYQQPSLAHEHQIVATPTLIMQMPLPVRRFIGNLANITDLFSLLDLGEKGRIVL
jgi:circadian clock protein KaiB